MANPELGPQQQGFVGSWQTVSFEAPDFLEPLREGIDSFFGILVDALSVLSGILEVAKVFASGLLDPVIAIIEKLRDEIENILNDLRKAGVYIHGDFYILQGPNFDELRGGFLAYEQRMLARLLDTSDPNRPVISSDSSVAAVFLYQGANATGADNLVNLIRSILKLFNRQPPQARLSSQAYNLQATYGYDGATIFSFNKSFFRGFVPRPNENAANPYNAVNLTWEMAPLQGPKFPAAPVYPPSGFLVEFSTFPFDLPLFYDRPVQGTLESLETSNQPAKRDVGQVIDEEGNPVFITGGLDQLQIASNLQFNDAVTVLGEYKPDAIRVFSGKNLNDPAPIQLSDLRDGDDYYIQRTFFVPAFQGSFFLGKKYGATFTHDQMPKSAEWRLRNDNKTERINEKETDKFYVRVRSVSKSVKAPDDVQYIVDQTSLRDQKGPIVPVTSGTTILDRGTSSEVLNILFPDVSTEIWLRLVAEALAILVLSRSDLSVLEGVPGYLDFPPKSGQKLKDGTIPSQWGQFQDFARISTGLEDLATFLAPQLTGRRQVSKYFEESGVDPASFRRALFVNCINTTNRLFSLNTPPLETRQLAISRAEALNNFRVQFANGEVTTDIVPNAEGFSVLELLTLEDPSFGVALNPSSLGVLGERASDLLRFSVNSSQTLARSPHFFSAERGSLILGSADSSPVFYTRTANTVQDMGFVRNEIPDEVYEAAKFVLSLAAGTEVKPQEQGWISFQLFPQGLPDVERFFDQILALLQSIQESIDSAAATITQFIEYLQSRINELQAFLNNLNALIQRLLRLFFSIQPTAGLVLVGSGTDGIIQGLVSAENKPDTNTLPEFSSDLGAGVVLLAGGLPNFIMEIFLALFSGDS